MRTWLQPVQFASGPAGRPRRVHLRRVELEENGTRELGKPLLTVVSVSAQALCGILGVVPAENRRERATCPQCLRLAEPFWTQLTGKQYAALVRETEQEAVS